MFWFTEPSSGRFLQQSKGTFSECANYGIPYCLRIIPTSKIMLNSVGRCIIWNSSVRTCWIYLYFVLRIGLRMVQWTETCRHIYNIDNTIYLMFKGPCILSIFQYISNKMQCYTVYLYLETALHVSGGHATWNM